MIGLDSIVEALANNLMDLMPFVVVKSYERGCRWSLGTRPVELEPGIHLRVYLYHHIQTGCVVDDAIELPIQSVITRDEKLVCFKVSFGYRINDVVKHLCNVTDFRESTVAIAKQHLAKRVRSMTLQELTNDLSKLEGSLETTLTTKFKGWGTEVFSVGFTDFAEVPTQLRIFQDASATHIL